MWQRDISLQCDPHIIKKTLTFMVKGHECTTSKSKSKRPMHSWINVLWYLKTVNKLFLQLNW